MVLEEGTGVDTFGGLDAMIAFGTRCDVRSNASLLTRPNDSHDLSSRRTARDKECSEMDPSRT